MSVLKQERIVKMAKRIVEFMPDERWTWHEHTDSFSVRIPDYGVFSYNPKQLRDDHTLLQKVILELDERESELMDHESMLWDFVAELNELVGIGLVINSYQKKEAIVNVMKAEAETKFIAIAKAIK